MSRTALARRSLRHCVRPHRKRIGAIFACSALRTVFTLAPALLVKSFVDDLQHHHPSFGHDGALLGAGAVLILLAGSMGVLRTWLVLSVRASVVADIRQDVTERLLGQSLSYFTRRRGGELMSRLLNDVSSVESMLESTLAATGAVVVVTVTVVAMFVVEWHLALLAVLLVPVLAFGLRRGSRPVYRRRMRVQEQLGLLSGQLQESLSLSGIMLIKSFGREHSERTRFASLNDQVRRSQISAGLAAGWIGLGLSMVQFVGPAVFLLAGSWLVVHGHITLGTLAAFVTVLGLQFGTALTSLGNGLASFVGALPAWSRIFEVLDDTPDVTERPDATALVDPRAEVQFDAVTFTYPGRGRPALEAVTLTIEPGQLVAVVGPSGAGKTTLCNLATRFYDPQAGAVRIDGADVRALTLESLGRVAGLVLQETYLFHGTLRDNLLYAEPRASADELAAACDDAQLTSLIAALPDGLDTVVGERGHRLSGGEKQRVAIARVILKDAPLLILDEATSHLDSASEALVQAALARLFRGRSSLVIAHRLSTVLAADQIVVLDQGRLVERGTHAELVAAGGLYHSLYELQFRADRVERAKT